MTEKPKNNILSNIVTPNVYDELIKQIEPTIIPNELIESISITYDSGNVVTLKGSDISQPVPVRSYQTPEQRKESRKHIADIRIFINTKLLAKYVDGSVDELFGKFDLL